MKLLKFEKVRNGKYLKNYELTYLNKANQEKKYEIVSRKDLNSPEEIGAVSSGISIVGLCGDTLLLLNEFRMGVNRRIYNLCAGMIEEDELVEDCAKRELYEETGLELQDIITVLPVSYAAVGISDVSTNIVIARVKGQLGNHTTVNEDIIAGLYTKEEVAKLIETEKFSSRAQFAAYMFVMGGFDQYFEK